MIKKMIIGILAVIGLLFLLGCIAVFIEENEVRKDEQITEVDECLSTLENETQVITKPETTNKVVKNTQKIQEAVSCKFNVKCHENMFFSKYDVDTYIDNKKVCNIKHGSSKEFDIKIEKGEHTIKFKSKDKEYKAAVGSRKIVLKKNTTFFYALSCSSDVIDIKDLNISAENGVNEDNWNDYFIYRYNRLSKKNRISKKNFKIIETDAGDATIININKSKFVLSKADGSPYYYLQSGMKYSKKHKKVFLVEAKKILRIVYGLNKDEAKKIVKKVSKGKYPYDESSSFVSAIGARYGITFDSLDGDEKFYMAFSSNVY